MPLYKINDKYIEWDKLVEIKDNVRIITFTDTFKCNFAFTIKSKVSFLILTIDDRNILADYHVDKIISVESHLGPVKFDEDKTKEYLIEHKLHYFTWPSYREELNELIEKYS